ncbi:MAG: helix-turn-helix domain-containing protein [Pseudomonadota bacterium]
MDWHPAQVKAALEMSGTNLAQLARQHKYKHLNDVLNRPWVAAELIVARALKTTPQEIWPSRYKRSRDRAMALTRNAEVLKQHKTTLRPKVAKA